MNKFIRFAAALATLVVIPALPAFASDYAPPGADATKGMVGVYIPDLSIGAMTNSLVVDGNSVPDAAGLRKFCPSMETGGCGLTGNYFYKVMAVLPPCGDVQENCIESVDIYKDGHEPTAAKYLKSVNGISFSSTPGIGNPAGSTPSIWEAASVPNSAGSTKYVVTPGLNYEVRNGNFTITNFGLMVSPVVDVSNGDFTPAKIGYNTINGLVSTHVEDGNKSGSMVCAATDVGYCAKKVDYAEGTRVRVALRLSNKVTGWLHGRVSNPSITVAKLSAVSNRITIDADPAVVPEMYAEVDYQAQTPRVQHDLDNMYSGGGNDYLHKTWRTYPPESPMAFDFVQLFATQAKDTVANVKTSWTIASFGEGTSDNECLNDNTKLVGVVTTNALSYDGGAPRFDGTTLKYRVAGLHWMPDGKTPVEGTYDLTMRSETARCLYGFSKAPISASITVTGANGESKVATTVVSEKDGWLHLAAYGFTFSSPTISVKLSQAAAPAKKTTITCVKGKLTKKVTAIGPKCPAGYKKK
jgi:hypothetical protein